MDFRRSKDNNYKNCLFLYPPTLGCLYFLNYTNIAQFLKKTINFFKYTPEKTDDFPSIKAKKLSPTKHTQLCGGPNTFISDWDTSLME